MANKPSTYFSIQPHIFQIKGRKGNPDETTTEMALFYRREILAIEYVPLATVGSRVKYLKEAALKTIADIAKSCYDEKVTGILLKEKGFEKVLQLLNSHQIPAVDFCNWVQEEILAAPMVHRGRVAEAKPPKAKMDPRVTTLVGVMAGLSKNKIPDEVAIELRDWVTDEDLMHEAVTALTNKLVVNKRDRDGYILLRVRSKDHKAAVS